jgi:hypothetical protein
MPKFVGLAAAAFKIWIKELETEGEVRVASTHLTQMAQRLRAPAGNCRAES